MTTTITDTTIVTCDPQRTVHYGAGIAIDEGRIAAIGPTDEIQARYPNADRIDGHGRAVFPGMVNCHTHMLATADRGILEDFGFPTTLRFPTTGRGLLDSGGAQRFRPARGSRVDPQRRHYPAGDLGPHSAVCRQPRQCGHSTVPGRELQRHRRRASSPQVATSSRMPSWTQGFSAAPTSYRRGTAGTMAACSAS